MSFFAARSLAKLGSAATLCAAKAQNSFLFPRSMSTVMDHTIHLTFVDREVIFPSLRWREFLLSQISMSWVPCFLLLTLRLDSCFLMLQGHRATVPARVGSTLLDAASLHNIDLEGPCLGGGGPTEVRRTENWVETTFGEGPSCFFW